MSAFVALLLLTMAFALAQSVGTKAIPVIQFEPGAQTTVLAGTLSPPVTVGPDMTSDGSERYSLRARSGQVLTIELSSDNHGALFSLIKPSQAMVKYEIVAGADAVKRWSGRLTASGNYLVAVFTRDRQTASRFADSRRASPSTNLCRASAHLLGRLSQLDQVKSS